MDIAGDGIVSTSNTKQAAAWLVFGAQLSTHNPVKFETRYKKADYLAPDGPKNGKNIGFWNFACTAMKFLQTINKGFFSKTADQEFNDFVKTLTLSLEQRTNLLALHNDALAMVCREAQEAHEKLVNIVKQEMPKGLNGGPDARWVVVEGRGQNASFGYNASEETKIELLNNLP